MKYQILKNGDPKKLAIEVNKMIEKGWIPQGGLAFQILEIKGKHVSTTLQAMIKTKFD